MPKHTKEIGLELKKTTGYATEGKNINASWNDLIEDYF